MNIKPHNLHCRSSEDLVHRLFVCIAGVADQLQTNFASDLRNILKCVFLMNSSQATNEDEEEETKQHEEEQPPSSPVDSNPPSTPNGSIERQDSVEDEGVAEDHEPNEERSEFFFYRLQSTQRCAFGEFRNIRDWN